MSLHDEAKREFASTIESETGTEVRVEYNIAGRGQRKPDIFIPYGLDKVRKLYNRCYPDVEYSDNRTAAIEVKWSKSDVSRLEPQLRDLENRGISNLFGLVHSDINSRATEKYPVITYDDNLNFYKSETDINISTPKAGKVSKSDIDSFVEDEISLRLIKEEWKTRMLTNYFTIMQSENNVDMEVWADLVIEHYPHRTLYFNDLLSLARQYNPYYYLCSSDQLKEVVSLVPQRSNPMMQIVKA